MLIFFPQITSRNTYTFRIIFERILNTNVVFTTDIDIFLASDEPKMAYSSQRIETPIWLEASSLLFENSIEKKAIIPEKCEEVTLFFPSSTGSFRIDIAAVIFFLISRYEEYGKDNLVDKHGRFQCQNSVAYQLGWHRKLMVHRLALELAGVIKEHYPQFEYSLPKFEELSTHDVDIAYQYKGKTWWRWCAAIAKELMKFRIHSVKNYLKVALGKNIDDPFDNFEPENKSGKPIYFIPTAPFGKYDKNISPNSNAFKELINRLKNFSEIGIHPSYHSSRKTTLIEKEKKQLEVVLQTKVTKSRQHFLRFRFPTTFQALIQAGITDDYSLGWHDEVGFRASIAVPYPFFDLEKNEETALMLHPLAFMDGIFSKAEEPVVLSELEEEVKMLGGVLILLRHNSN
ncbi:MAG: polysaccharide deacetylase family protein [Bacteroidales bacterium]|jgi:hypothetical protein|nr:polysaccharide deacetylase family protein [Bacteroidales bacterium]